MGVAEGEGRLVDEMFGAEEEDDDDEGADLEMDTEDADQERDTDPSPPDVATPDASFIIAPVVQRKSNGNGIGNGLSIGSVRVTGEGETPRSMQRDQG